MKQQQQQQPQSRPQHDNTKRHDDIGYPFSIQSNDERRRIGQDQQQEEHHASNIPRLHSVLSRSRSPSKGRISHLHNF